MENKTFKYVASICFAVLAVWNIVNCFNYFNFLGLIATIGSVLVVIALLTKTPILSAIGFALMALETIVECVRNIGIILEGWIPFFLLPLWLLYIAVCVLLMLASITPKSAKALGIIAAVIAIIRIVVVVIGNITEGYGTTAGNIIWGLLFAAGAMLLGLTYYNFSLKAVSNKVIAVQSSNTSAQGILDDSNVEKLMRLKGFLDEGVITQEEFDEKKKQLFGH